MAKHTDIIRRTLCIAALFSLFVIVGAPGGGGRGGFSGGGGRGSSGGGFRSSSYRRSSYRSGGGYYRSSDSRPRTEKEKKEDRRLGVLLGATAGVVCLGSLFWYGYNDIKRGQVLRGATVRVTAVALLDGDAHGHARFFDQILKSGDLSVPQQRAAALNRVLAHLAGASVRDGFVQMDSRATAQQAGAAAESLAKRQTQCVDTPRSTRAMGELSCVVGFTITTTPERAKRMAAGSGRDHLARACESLNHISSNALDAFYLFYSPAPNDALPRTEAEQIMENLQHMGSPIPPRVA